MLGLPSKIEELGDGIIAHCHFSVGFVTSAKPLLLKGLLDMIDNVKTSIIHYDYSMDWDSETIHIMECTKPNKRGIIELPLYTEDDNYITEVYVGNSLFIPTGDVNLAREKLHTDIKDQLATIYETLRLGRCEFVYKGE